MKNAFLYAMAVLYIAAGINHFIHPAFYIKIMPPWLPYHTALILISGVCEIVFGLLLLLPSARRPAAWLIILMLIAIFPANIQMMVNYLHENNPRLWIAIVRLPLQLVLIWWAYYFTKKTKQA
jgi:uncharacterized membrane protein